MFQRSLQTQQKTLLALINRSESAKQEADAATTAVYEEASSIKQAFKNVEQSICKQALDKVENADEFIAKVFELLAEKCGKQPSQRYVNEQIRSRHSEFVSFSDKALEYASRQAQAIFMLSTINETLPKLMAQFEQLQEKIGLDVNQIQKELEIADTAYHKIKSRVSEAKEHLDIIVPDLVRQLIRLQDLRERCEKEVRDSFERSAKQIGTQSKLKFEMPLLPTLEQFGIRYQLSDLVLA